MSFRAKKLTPIDTSSLAKLGQGVVNLSKYTEDEFSQVAKAFQSTDADPILYAAPPKPRRGTIVYADGTHWNPGAGEGPYYYNGTTWIPLFQYPPGPVVVRSHLAGLTLSTAGASSTFSVAAGQAANSTNADYITLAAAMSKTTGAWAVGSGNGALDTGAIAASTWYKVFAIKRPDTGISDIAITTNALATGPTTGGNIPAAYTEVRYIGSMKTDASSHWIAFIQVGDEFLWVTPINDVNIVTLSTTAVLYALSVPIGVQVNALFRGAMANSTAGQLILINSPDENAAVVYVPTGNLTSSNPVGTVAGTFTLNLRTNTSGQIRFVAQSGSSTTLTVATYGWIDHRGRDA
jgi:hypothetical protein